MRVRLLAPTGTPEPGTLADAGFPREYVVFEGIIDDYRFVPDIITINGQEAYRFGHNIHEGKGKISVYRKATSHNIVVTAPTTSTPKEVSDEH